MCERCGDRGGLGKGACVAAEYVLNAQHKQLKLKIKKNNTCSGLNFHSNIHFNSRAVKSFCPAGQEMADYLSPK